MRLRRLGLLCSIGIVIRIIILEKASHLAAHVALIKGIVL